MTLSFAAMALLPVLAAIVAGLGQQAIRKPLALAAETSLVFNRDQREVAKTIVDLEALIGGRDPGGRSDDLRPFTGSVAAKLSTIDERLGSARYLTFAPERLVNLRRSADAVTVAANEFVRRERSIVEQRAELARLRERFDAKVQELDAAARDLAATLPGARGDQQRSLSDVRFSGSTMLLRLDNALVAAGAADVGEAEARFAEAYRGVAFQLSLLPESALRTELARILVALFEWGRGEDNLFERRRRLLGSLATQRQLQASIRSLLQRMFDEVDALTEHNNRLLNDLLTGARDTLTTALAAVLAAGAFGLIIALVVLLKYVRPTIIRRLQNLRATTLRLSAGDVDVEIAPQGDDEITDLERAVLALRENTRQLRERDDALAQRSEELLQANKELDDFAYVASHDLRAPLRAIDNLAAFLQEDLGDELAEDSARHLALMRSRIQRLDGLLTGLLEYSRVGRTDQAVSVVNLRPLIEHSAELIVPDSFRLELIGDFPRVRTRAIPLEQIVRNLVDNAVKHHDRDDGHVIVKGVAEEAVFELSITDDGPGIEPKFHERVFGMFQTLKSRDDVEGSGMGLAILKKLVETHGGSIALDSDPARGRGTTFTVRWPVTVIDSNPEAPVDQSEVPAENRVVSG